ncbi:MAG TPA: ubiquitin-like domain-containing protein [Anaerolineales bacterium]|nr:ubiquitin-like domain-containing protein [Anaerolineales bacterium]
MKIYPGLAFLFTLLLAACQPSVSSSVVILDNDKLTTLQTEERVPSALLREAGITLNAHDKVLVNGFPAPLDRPITDYPIVLQTRRAITLTLVTPEGHRQIPSAAFTIGEALAEASIWLHASDEIDLPLASANRNSATVHFFPSHPITIEADGQQVQIQSSAKTVGESLAEAGIPLIGLDYSVPAEKEPLPSDGQIKVVRVSESLLLAQRPIPFGSEIQASAEVPLDQTQILQPGETGLSVQRIRIRYKDGNEVSRVTENETLVRPPKTRVLGYGTKVEIKTATVDGVQIEYWRAVQMYATSYSPCNSGVSNCGAHTASGKALRKGMVAVNRTLYYSMQGQQLFIPGYGHATIEDLCGGCVGKPWIDLAYGDHDYQSWHSWVTVYFLTPVPSNIIYVLE